MLVLDFIIIVVTILYATLFLYYLVGFYKHPYFYSFASSNSIPITIIICARNEEKNLPACLISLIEQDYKKENISIIIVNDASSDGTVNVAERILKNSNLNYRIITNTKQIGKKHSITSAVNSCNTDLIVLRDADTFTSSKIWLQTICDFYLETKSNFIIAPIAFKQNSGLLWALQVIENNILALLTIGSAYYKKPFLCSAANLAFTKNIFQQTNGFQSHANIASGDDVLFLEDVKKLKDVTISYLKSQSALVYTYALPSFKSLLLQKIRWANKHSKNPNKTNTLLSVLVFVTNIVWLLSFCVCFFVPQNQSLSLFFVLFKLIFDSLLLFLTSGFIKNSSVLAYAFTIGLIYPFYVLVLAISTLFLKPKWK